MKFSKVKNYKTAVISRIDTTEGSGARDKTGVLYLDPAKYGKCIKDNVEDHVESQITDAQKLYRVFNPVTDENGELSTIKAISEIIDSAIEDKRDLSNGTLTAYKMYSQILYTWNSNNMTGSESQIDKAVDLYLRRTLYQKSNQTVKHLLKLVAENKHWNTLTEQEQTEIAAFLDDLKKDYQYSKVLKHVANSIEHQNIVIQPNEKGILIPAAIKNAKKRNRTEKEALTAFLSEYAVLDESVRRNLRIRLRRLVDLYFYGSDEVLTNDFCEWSDHAVRRERTEFFSEELAAFINSVNGNVAEEDSKKQNKGDTSSAAENSENQTTRTPKASKDWIRIVQQMYRKENIRRYRLSIKTIKAYSNEASSDTITDDEVTTVKDLTSSTELSIVEKTPYFQDESINMFWIRYIEKSVERIYNNFRSLDDYRLSVGYLSEKVWKGIFSFLSGKYIATGKAVYHFAFQELSPQKEEADTSQIVENTQTQETQNSQNSQVARNKGKNKGRKKQHQKAVSKRAMIGAAEQARNNTANIVNNTIANSADTIDSKPRLEDSTVSLDLGKIRENLKSGLNSFDYEMLKAEEDLQRSTAVYVAFAANHLSAATVDLALLEGEEGKEDFLTLKRKDLARVVKTPLRRNILQFFGGESMWGDFCFEDYYRKPNKNQYDDLDFLDDLKTIIFAMRNESFHFETRRENKGTWNQNLITAMFEHDCAAASKLQKEKFFANNLPMFYDETTLDTLLKALYKNQTSRASQVPSFNRVVVRNDFSDFIHDNLKWNISFEENSVSRKKQFDSALYYLFKEIYYNLFLQGKGLNGKFDVKKEFINWCDDEKNGEENHHAFESFTSRVNTINGSKDDITLAEICQRIMTDYNLYNNKSHKVRSSFAKNKKADNYDHYKMLLYKGLREVFAVYINNVFHDLELYKPIYRDKPSAENFLPDYSASTYDSLVKKVQGNAELQKWYIIGRLLNPRQVNLFIGSLRQYIQYTEQIQRRAKDTKTKTAFLKSSKNYFLYEKVLEVCIQLSGTTTNRLEDYFDDEDDYARHVAMYLDFEGAYPGIDISAQLKQFCSENIDTINRETGNDPEITNIHDMNGSNELKSLGIFYDENNPILNRNILLAKIYGTERVLSKIMRDRKVTKEDILDFYSQRKLIEEYRITGKCKTKDQQKALKKYQEIKNKVELYNIVEYEEIIDEIHAQMIDWCYMRERDLMYFQLGFHYTCLNNNSSKAEWYKRIEHDARIIEGAILYQIAAMYIVGIPIYTFKDNNLLCEPESQPVWMKINRFIDYSIGCLKQSPPFSSTDREISVDEAQSIYFAGMELFENIKEHDNIVALRNYIEHFHYYAHLDRSLLDICSEIFDRFFSYDLKYQKNVVVRIYNILMHHFVKPVFAFSTGQKSVGTRKEAITKNRATITLRQGRGLYSEKMYYKVYKTNDSKNNDNDKEKEKEKKNNNSESNNNSNMIVSEKTTLDAKSRDFLDGVSMLLTYPDCLR